MFMKKIWSRVSRCIRFYSTFKLPVNHFTNSHISKFSRFIFGELGSIKPFRGDTEMNFSYTTRSNICICSECVERRGLSAEEIERRIPKAKSVGGLFKILILYDMALKGAKGREIKQ